MDKGKTRIIAIGVDLDKINLEPDSEAIIIGDNDNHIIISSDGFVTGSPDKDGTVRYFYNRKNIYPAIKQALMDNIEDLDND